MRRKQQQQQMIQMRGKSANRCSGSGDAGNGPAFTSPPPPPDTTTRSHQKSSSSKTRSFRSSWTPFPSRMRSRSSSSTTFSTSMSTWQATFLLICALLAVLEIGCTFGAAAAAGGNSSHPTPSILERVTSSHGGGGGGGGHRHKCYLCLPPDKSSAEALDIYKMFKNNGGREQDVQDCTGFSSSKNKKPYEFDCPVGYQGCVLKTHGTNVSRTCAQFQFNACRVANAKELCFCTGPLCNDEKANMIIFPDSEGSSQQAAAAAAPPSPQPLPSSSTSLGGGESISSEERSRDTLAEEQEESESRKFWQKGETDDEDLLEMADDTGSSGDGPYPPGVIDAYTTTPKPTLVPNIRGDRVKTTPPPTTTAGGARPPSASSFVPHLVLLLGSYTYYLSCYLVNMHHRP